MLVKSFIMIKVPILSKRGESLGEAYLNKSNILYMREWRTEDGRDLTVAYMIGGKDIIIESSLSDVKYLFNISCEETKV